VLSVVISVTPLCPFISLWFPLGAYCQWRPGGRDLRVLISVTSLRVYLSASRVLSHSGSLSVVIVSGARVARCLYTSLSVFYVCCMISRCFPLSGQCTLLSDFFVSVYLSVVPSRCLLSVAPGWPRSPCTYLSDFFVGISV
jgi:hypothetical protein